MSPDAWASPDGAATDPHRASDQGTWSDLVEPSAGGLSGWYQVPIQPSAPGNPPVPAVDPGLNWGLGQPRGGWPERLVPVPRPPRPAVVMIGLLSAVSVPVVGALGVVLVMLQGSAEVGVVALPLWLILAAPIGVCAYFTHRGANLARKLLCGVLVIVTLGCGCGLGPLLPEMSDPSAAGMETPFVLLTATVLALAAIALVTVVLLLTPPANRYFFPGPGRRFDPTANK